VKTDPVDARRVCGRESHVPLSTLWISGDHFLMILWSVLVQNQRLVATMLEIMLLQNFVNHWNENLEFGPKLLNQTRQRVHDRLS